MTKTLKKTLAIVVALALCLSAFMGCFSVSAVDTNKVTVIGPEAAVAVNTETVDVKVNITAAEFAAALLVIDFGCEKMVKQSVICGKLSGYEFKMNNDTDLNKKISCMLFDKDDYLKVLCLGSNGNSVINKSKILDYINSLNKDRENKRQVIENNKLEEKKTTKDEFKERENLIEKNDMDKTVEDVGSENKELKLEECIEKSATKDVVCGVRDVDEIASMAVKESLFDSDLSEVEKEISNSIIDGGESFFEMIEEQIDELFAKYPLEENLAEVVPNSKWVKVNYDDNSKGYVVGLIYELETIKYVAYGVPAKFGETVPSSLEDCSQWISKEINNSDGDGYFVMFQDAITGESVIIK